MKNFKSKPAPRVQRYYRRWSAAEQQRRQFVKREHGVDYLIDELGNFIVDEQGNRIIVS